MTEQWHVKPAALRRGDQTVGYATFIVDDKGHLKEWAIKEDAIRNTYTYTWPQTPELAMARYEEAEELGEVAAERPYAPLIKSVPLPTGEEAA